MCACVCTHCVSLCVSTVLSYKGHRFKGSLQGLVKDYFLLEPHLIPGNDRAKQYLTLEMKGGGVITAVHCHGNPRCHHSNPR